MINKVILMGRLTKDPEMRKTRQDNVVARFSLAIDDGYGENKRTDFIQCQAWNKTAEFIEKYFSKGSMIIIDEGKIALNQWEDDAGKKHYDTYVLAQSVKFGGTKKKEETTGSGNMEDDAFTPLLDEDDDLPF